MNPELIRVCADLLEVDPSLLGPDASSETIPAWDSLLHWEIIAEVEEAFDVTFDMDQAVGFQKLGDIQAALEAAGVESR